MPDAAAPAAAAPADVPVSKEGYVWYFAYGSNMNAKVLTGRRNVHPINSVPAKLDGYVLGFNLLGIPYTEPGMATVQPLTPLLRAKAAAALPANSQQTNGLVNGAYTNGTSPATATATAKPRLTSEEAFALRVQAGLHGVLHLITKDDWEIVKATEGVRLKGIGYQVVHVDCTLYDGRTIPALTLQAAPVSSGDIKHFLPSVRYLNIIRDGAREYGVDPAYCAMLERHPAYEVQQGVATSLAKAGLTGTGIALFMPMVPVLLGAAAVKRASKLLGFSTSTPAPATSTRSASPDPTPADGMASTRHKEQPEPAATVLQEPATNGVDGSGRGAASPAGAVSPGAAAGGAAGTQAPASSSSGSGSEARPPPLFKMLSMMREVLDPRVTSFYMWGMFRGMWFVHDWVMSPLLGSGRDNDHVVRAARAAAARRGAAVKQD